MRGYPKGLCGYSLIEMVVTLALFGIITALMYGTFTVVQRQVALTSSDTSLAAKGERILTFIEDDIRMIGYLLGPDARIPYCTGSTVPPVSPNVITHISSTPYDTLQFITSQPVMISESAECFGNQQALNGGAAPSDYFLTTVDTTVTGSNTVKVDAQSSCFDDISSEDGRSLITFDSLLLSAATIAGIAPKLYYQVDSLQGTSATLTDTLQQDIPHNSTVYVIRQYKYSVTTTGGKRNLVRTSWDRKCGEDPVKLIETSSSSTAAGGVDGFKVEFTYFDAIKNIMVTQATLPPLSQLKTVTVWLLIRSDRIDNNYSDTSTYVMGRSQDKITRGPFNDHFRRLLITKTIEVKNLVSFY
jgi:prepilin-type N-terminal cleavage/methylation domain-containing protein